MPGVANKQRKDFKLRRRQFDRLAITRDAVVEDIDDQSSAMVDGFLATGLQAAAKHGADARQQLARSEGFLDVVIGAKIESGDKSGRAALT